MSSAIQNDRKCFSFFASIYRTKLDILAYDAISDVILYNICNSQSGGLCSQSMRSN